jgi:hypothetical protein
MCGIRVATECRANAVEFVSRDRSADSTPANQYANLRGALLHRFGNLFRVVRIIVRNRTVVRAKVNQIVMGMAQFLDDSFIQRITAMIRSDYNSHFALFVPFCG